MEIDKLTIGELKQINSLLKCGDDECLWKVGEKYLIRTVTMMYTGRVQAVTSKELLLSDCAWIADSGRFYGALSTGELSEVEPMPGNVIIGRGAIVDGSVWNHKLPQKQI